MRIDCERLRPNSAKAETPGSARRGSALVYVTCLLPLILAFGALAVDFGRTQVAKCELQATTDTAARYAAMALRTQSNGESAAADNAAAVFAQNKVDGSAAPFNRTTDLQIGIWSASNKTFTPATLADGANAVRITAKITLGDAARPYACASALGLKSTVHAQSTVMVNSKPLSSHVYSRGNVWLSGMPAGTVSDNNQPGSSSAWDTAGSGPGNQGSPAVLDLAAGGVTGGTVITFDTVTGSTSTNTSRPNTGPDGEPTLTRYSLGDTNTTTNAYVSTPKFGMSNMRAPSGALVAVFLNDSRPDTSGAPPALDFSTQSQRDYVSIAPMLKQVFFIGDGRNNSTNEAQNIVVPSGATRMFVGAMDAHHWYDNLGSFDVTANATLKVTTVK